MSECGVKVGVTPSGAVQAIEGANSVRNGVNENTSIRRSKPAFFRSAPGIFVIASFSQPGRTYQVIRSKNGESWECSCKGHFYRGHCNHVSICQAFEEAIDCGFDQPTEEDLLYYLEIETARANRQKRGIPLEAP